MLQSCVSPGLCYLCDSCRPSLHESRKLADHSPSSSNSHVVGSLVHADSLPRSTASSSHFTTPRDADWQTPQPGSDKGAQTKPERAVTTPIKSYAAVAALTSRTVPPKKTLHNLPNKTASSNESKPVPETPSTTKNIKKPGKLGAQLKAVLEKVSALEELVKNKAQDDHPVLAQPPQQNRKRCLIIMNAPESNKQVNTERILDDQEVLQNLMWKLFDAGDEAITVVTAFRLGKKADDPTTQPRPLKVVLASEEECQRVFSRCHRLKGDSLRVFRDLCPEDRVRMRMACQELKQRLHNGEQNLHIVDFQVVMRRPRVVWEPITIHPRVLAHPTSTS